MAKKKPWGLGEGGVSVKIRLQNHDQRDSMDPIWLCDSDMDLMTTQVHDFPHKLCLHKVFSPTLTIAYKRSFYLVPVEAPAVSGTLNEILQHFSYKSQTLF